jgi:hypothetical protein
MVQTSLRCDVLKRHRRREVLGWIFARSSSSYCLVDEWLRPQPPIRRRGMAPLLRDSEVLTMGVVGEYLGIDTDMGLYRYVRQHYGDWFPALTCVDRTTFARQSANLWIVKGQLWQHLLTEVERDPALSIGDRCPVPVCRFARARRCRRLRAVAAYGKDQADHQAFYGFRAHIRIGWPGVIVASRLAPANADAVAGAGTDLLDGAAGWVLGDRNSWRPAAQVRLR